jgi:MarR family 2-MHQ and catechol resistance regulon transcriptional repressor
VNQLPCDPETRRALRLFVVLARAAKSVADHARADIARHGLSVSEFGILELLYHKGPQSLGVLSEKILLTTGSVTYVVDQLEAQGMVRRVTCSTDRRVTYAELTEPGRARIAALFPPHADVIRRAVSGLSPEEQETALNLLKKLGRAAAALPAPNEKKE